MSFFAWMGILLCGGIIAAIIYIGVVLFLAGSVMRERSTTVVGGCLLVFGGLAASALWHQLPLTITVQWVTS
jgi:hypothetical protein